MTPYVGPSRLWPLLLALAVALIGCGGGSGEPQTIVVTESVEESLQDNGGVTSPQILVADFNDNGWIRGMWTFPLPTFEPGVEIVSATLHATLESTNRGLYATNGPVVLDHVDSTIFDTAEKRDGPALRE